MLEGASVSSLLVYITYFTIERKTMAQTSKYKRVVLKLSGEDSQETKVLVLIQSLLKAWHSK